MRPEERKKKMSFFDARYDIQEELRKIIELKYIYSVDEVSDILKVSREYVQRNICSELDTFYLDRFFKMYIKSCDGDLDAYEEVIEYVPELSSIDIDTFINLNSTTIDLIGRSALNKFRLSRRILISKVQLKDFLLDFFSVEVDAPSKENEGVYCSLNEDHVDAILNSKLEDINHLKEYYDVKTLLQVSRRLEKNDPYVVHKFVKKADIREYGKKRSLTRYLCNYNLLSDFDNCDYPSNVTNDCSEIEFSLD